MRRKNNSIMKRFALVIMIFGVFFLSCKNEKTFKYYMFDFYPIKEINNSGTWIKTDFLSNEKISFQINSFRILEEYHDFEPLDISICNLYSNKDFIVNSDTIKAGENILNRINGEMISFKQQDNALICYYLVIQSTSNNRLNIKSDYYQFNFEGKTNMGFEIKDSLIVKYINNTR